MTKEIWKARILRASEAHDAALDAAGTVFDDAAPEDE